MATHAVTLERLKSAARSGADLVTFWRLVTPLLADAVPHFEAPCFFTVDPASLLITSHFQEGLPEIPAEWLGRDYVEDDYNSMPDVLASAQGYGTLHEATGGRPELATKYHAEMQPFGCEQELLVALRTRSEETWGVMGLYREAGRRPFDLAEIEFALAAAPSLAEGARFGLRRGLAEDPDLPDSPGLLLLTDELALDAHTEAATRWLDDLGGAPDELPATVYAVARRALHSVDDAAFARVRGASGRWMVLHGAAVSGAGAARVSIVLEPAHPERLAPLLMQAYALTPREQDVTRLAIRGASTADVARGLSIAESTVQQHLKSIFEKTGVRSRRELVGRIFTTHYEPRVRDNERRTVGSRPARDGPWGG
jgi:DNA-binding CsgD family transcriptional regulator